MTKELLAIGAALLIIVAYTPYIQDIITGKARPHPYTWFISGFITFLIFGLQVKAHAGWGSIPTCIAAVAGLLVFGLCLKYKRPPITKLDNAFFVLAVLATGLWLLADQPAASVILIALIDVLAFVPTFRKSWQHPEQETAAMYYANALRFTLAAVAVQQYGIITLLYPISAALLDGGFAIFLTLRLRVLQLNARRSPQEIETYDLLS